MEKRLKLTAEIVLQLEKKRIEFLQKDTAAAVLLRLSPRNGFSCERCEPRKPYVSYQTAISYQ